MVRRASQKDRLRRAREERNLTQADVARAVGTSSFTVSRWELGVQTPQPHFRERLCRLFALSPQELGLIPELRPLPRSEQPSWMSNGHVADSDGSHDPAETRARRDLLGQVWRYWIGTHLEAAIGGLPRIALALAERPGAVDDPLRVLPQPDEPDRPLAPGTSIESAYRRSGEQLLILGDPGAGKTTLLLALAEWLLLESTPDGPHGPMPVVFHLASWAEDRQPLARWLVDELHHRYGVAHRLGREWIASDQVLPLLDGLDEVAEEHRSACVAAVNVFHGEHGQLPLVVCCRTAQYESLDVRLRMRGAVVVLPLTREQVERYLAEAGDTVTDVRALVDDDERLLELLATPLFLSIMVSTYGGGPRATPPLQGTLPERRRRVLADYVHEMLARPRAMGRPPHSPRQTMAWLAWLAGAMRDRGEGVFYIDRIQPGWLPSRVQRPLVTLGPAALVVITGGVVGTLDMLVASALLRTHTYLLNVAAGLGAMVRVSLPGDVAGGALAGAAVGLMAGLLAAVFTYERRIAPTDRLGWSWTTFRRNLPSVLAAVLGAMLVSLVVDRVLTGVVVHLVYGLLLILLFKASTQKGVRGGIPWPWSAIRQRLPHRWQLAGALTAVLAVALAAFAVAAIISGAPPRTLAYRLGARLLVGLSLGLMFGPHTPLCEGGHAPGQGIATSRRNGLVSGLVSGLVAVLLFGLVDGVSVAREAGGPVGMVTGLVDGLSIGVIVGLGVSLRRGAGAYLRHAILRRLLVRAGAAPHDYVGFLDSAADLILLRRRGAGYEFVHRLLLDHFADLRTG